MPIAHGCRGCGEELARVCPQHDPALGLSVVVCPRCASADVRRRHPLIAGRRTARRAVRAFTGMALRAFGFAIAVFGSVGMAFLLAETFHDAHPVALLNHLTGSAPDPALMEIWWAAGGPAFLGILVVWAWASGAVLTAMFGHAARRATPWRVFAASVTGVMGLFLAIDWADSFRAYALGGQVPQGSVAAKEFASAGLGVGLGIIVAAAGSPAGRLLSKHDANRRARRLRRALARARARKARR